ncbi:MAG: hypothetical protein J6C32_04455 [Eubacterium sp.]|nr:hypothetical protein [Eubacterium sp.]
MMGRKNQILIFIVILTSLLFSCSGGDGKSRQERASDSGITGQAMTDGGAGHKTASGGTASATGIDARAQKGKKYHFCNKYCLYYSEEFSRFIIEHQLSDGTERRIEMDYDVIVCYVDNDWVYYVENMYYYHFQSEVYRAPIKDKKLDIKKAEHIFTEKSGIHSEDVYCDGRYLVYITGESFDSSFRKYDLKEKKIIEGQDNEDMAAFLYGVAGDFVLYSEFDGVMRHDLYTGKTTDVSSSFLGPDDTDGQIAMTDTDVFYAEDSVEIRQYHLVDNSNKKIITYYQIRRFLIQEGFIDVAREKEYEYYPQRLFVSGLRLYVQMDIKWTEKKVFHQNKVVFSQKIGGNGKLRYEKGLTKCVANPKKDQRVFEKITYEEEDEGIDALYLSRGGCLYMAEEKCFMYLYDSQQRKNRVACYNLGSGEFRFLTKKDPDWYLPYYNGVQPYWKACVGYSEIRMDMPNNRSVDWPYW